jgi:hypothetical protein
LTSIGISLVDFLLRPLGSWHSFKRAQVVVNLILRMRTKTESGVRFALSSLPLPLPLPFETVLNNAVRYSPGSSCSLTRQSSAGVGAVQFVRSSLDLLF